MPNNSKVVDVVAALIWDGNRFLACQRPANKKRALLWEFPGGKVEAGETRQEALIREIHEELDADIEVLNQVAEVRHDYPDIDVRLSLFNACVSGQEPRQREHADMRWITAAQTDELEFCPADQDILTLLKEGRIEPPKVSS